MEGPLVWAGNGQRRADNGVFCAKMAEKRPKTTKNDRKRPMNDREMAEKWPMNGMRDGRCCAIVNH
jgi:hypothetical protein